MEPRNESYQRELRGGWLIAPAGELDCSGQSTSDLKFSPTGWFPASVPSTVLAALAENGHCQSPYFGMNLAAIRSEPFQQPWWYRTVFSLSQDEASGTILLEFDGINYAGEVWLNGRPISRDSEARGAFRHFQYDISACARPGDNVLAVRVVPPRPGDFSTGFVDWNPPPPDGNMGLFRSVRLRFCCGVSIEHPVVRSQVNVVTLDEASLTISLELMNHAPVPVSGTLEGRIETIQFSRDVHLEPRERKTVTLTAGECAQLHIAEPRLWWPYELGTPELYEMNVRFTCGPEVLDVARVRFGIRDVTDYWTEQGHRGFRINGRNVLIKGAGWTDDLLLADTPEKIDTQLRYVKHMNLNCVRCEGIWGKDQTLYDLCDEYGILVMVGWSCHWEHEQYLGKPVDERYGGVVSPEDIDLIANSWADQLLWLRNHPSIFAWAVASDKIPAPELERRYVEIFRDCDPTRPYLASTGGIGSEQRIIGSHEIVSQVSGNSGMKMLGPYAYTPPVYWYTDTRRGGAYGFNTETSPGAVVPTIESLRKMIPEQHLWPIDETWDFHCGLNEFNTLDRFREAVRLRYGQPDNLTDFSRKAQLLNYELMRPMFEAFRVNKGTATGVVQWMLNAAWPKMYWQLYDWYLMPTGAFYATRKACASPQLVYHYGHNSVYLVDDRLAGSKDMAASLCLYDIDSRVLLDTHVNAESQPECARRIFDLPGLTHLSPAYFLSLRLSGSGGQDLAENFYWLSAIPDVLDYDAKVSPWEYYTPSKQYADFTSLNSMPPAEIQVKHHFDALDGQDRITVELANNSDRIAFFIELLLLDEASNEPIVPIFWQDNYVSLRPGQRRTLVGHFAKSAGAPCLKVRPWNAIVT